MAAHEEFLELCVVSLSGELSADEQRKLEEHLKGRAPCREALEQFVAAAHSVEREDSDPSFSVEKAEATFFSRFDQEGGFEGRGLEEHTGGNHDPVVANGAGWGPPWMPFVAILLLCTALALLPIASE